MNLESGSKTADRTGGNDNDPRGRGAVERESVEIALRCLVNLRRALVMAVKEIEKLLELQGKKTG